MLQRLSNILVRTSNVRLRSRAFSTAEKATLVPAVVKQNRLQPHAYNSFDINFVGSGGSNPSRFRGMPCMTLFLGDIWYILESYQCSLCLQSFLWRPVTAFDFERSNLIVDTANNDTWQELLWFSSSMHSSLVLEILFGSHIFYLCKAISHLFNTIHNSIFAAALPVIAAETRVPHKSKLSKSIYSVLFLHRTSLLPLSYAK